MSKFLRKLWMMVIPIFFLFGGNVIAAEGEAHHGLSQSAPVIFELPLPGGIEIPFSNSLIMLFLAVLTISVVVWLGTKKMALIPGKMQNAIEWVVESLYSFVESLIGPRLTQRYFWYFGTVFLLVLVSNYMGLLPGVGTITYNGEPLFRGANADMNVTMFLGFSYAILWFVWSIREQGIKHFILHLFGPKGNMSGFLNVVLIPVFIFVGCVEVLSICIRPIALGARLFGNVYAGETIIETMSLMTSEVVWNVFCILPFLFMELLVGFIQALVFLLLTAIFLKLQVGDEDESHESTEEAS